MLFPPKNGQDHHQSLWRDCDHRCIFFFFLEVLVILPVIRGITNGIRGWRQYHLYSKSTSPSLEKQSTPLQRFPGSWFDCSQFCSTLGRVFSQRCCLTQNHALLGGALFYRLVDARTQVYPNLWCLWRAIPASVPLVGAEAWSQQH